MFRKLFLVGLCILFTVLPLVCPAGSPQADDSSYWSNLVHQENSLTASLLYVPYLILMPPIRILDGIINPKPTSQATIPPAAHRPAH